MSIPPGVISAIMELVTTMIPRISTIEERRRGSTTTDTGPITQHQ